MRILCTPNDPEGIFQALCAPRERVDLPADRYRVPFPGAAGSGSGPPWGHTRNNSSFSSTHTGGSFGGGGLLFRNSTGRPGTPGTPGTPSGNTPPASPLSPPWDGPAIPRDNSNLMHARLAAQARLEAAQRIPRYLVTVVDERGALVEKVGVGAFLGRVESRIRYVLAPDRVAGATDESGGVVSVEDLVRDDGGETVGLLDGGADKKSRRKGGTGDRDGIESDAEGAKGRRREGCTGRWNSHNSAVVDKKDKERWWHQERGRWRELMLS